MFASKVVYAACQWCILVALTKLSDAGTVGEWGLAMMITAPVFALCNLKLRSVLATDVKNRYTLSDYFGLRLATVTLALLIVLAISSAARFSVDTFLIVIVIGLAKGSESASDIFHGVMQKMERMERIGQAFLLKGIAILLIFPSILFLTQSLLAALLGILAICVAMLFFWDWPNAGRLLGDRSVLKPQFTISIMSQLARRTVPLGLADLINPMTTLVPKYFVAAYLGGAALGHFTAIAYVQMAGAVVILALSHSVIARLARQYHADLREFVRFFLKLLAIGAAIGGAGVVFAVLFGRLFLSIAYTPEYGEHVDVLILLMIAVAAADMKAFVVAALVAMERSRTWAVVTLLAVLVSLISASVLVPRYGLVGGAWAVLAGTWTSFVVGTLCVLVVTLSKMRRRLTETQVQFEETQSSAGRHSRRSRGVEVDGFLRQRNEA